MAQVAFPKLKILLISSSTVIQDIISSSIDIVKGVSELALNVLFNKNFELTAQQKTSLKKYKPILEKLADSNISLRIKQRLLIKQGKKVILTLLRVTLPYLAQHVQGDGSGSTDGVAAS